MPTAGAPTTECKWSLTFQDAQAEKSFRQEWAQSRLKVEAFWNGWMAAVVGLGGLLSLRDRDGKVGRHKAGTESVPFLGSLPPCHRLT